VMFLGTGPLSTLTKNYGRLQLAAPPPPAAKVAMN
jgi:hypothetical protein